VLYDGLNNYWYNAEGQLCAVYQSGGSVTTYLCDIEGRICAVKSEPVPGTYTITQYVFGARYYGSSMGRWLSPDWSANEDPVPYAKLDDPQSLNLYGEWAALKFLDARSVKIWGAPS
jgi:hypothetical protein